MLPMYLIGLGLLLLIVVLVVLLGRYRRFAAAADGLRGDLARGTAALPAVRPRRS